MNFEEFFFTPQTPVASGQGTFGLGFGTTDYQQFSAAITTGFENAQSLRNIDMQKYNPVTQQGTPLEVTQRYRSRLLQSSFYTSGDMALFNNELTEDVSATR